MLRGWGRALPHALAMAALAAVFAATLLLRWDLVTDPALGAVQRDRPMNGEVTAHFADVLRAYRTLPIGVHLLAPIMSPDGAEIALGRGLSAEREVARDTVRTPVIPWRVTRDGYLLYVSFPTGGFALAALALAPFGAADGVAPLMLLSLLLQPACAAMLYALLWAALFRRVPGGAWRHALCAAAASAYLLAPQPLHDHGSTIWAHHVLQPILLGVLLLLASSPAGRRAAPRAAALGALALLGAATEWTAHMLNAAACAASLWLALRDPAARRAHLAAAAAVCTGEAAALGALAMVYEHHIGLRAWLDVIPQRAEVRGGSWASEGGSFIQYAVSAGHGLGFHAAAAAVLWILVALGRRGAPAAAPAPRDPGADRGRAALACLAFACAENLVLMSHATAYPFDLLKTTLLAGAAIGCAAAALARAHGREAVAPVMAVVALASVGSAMHHEALYGNRISAETGRPVLGTVCARATTDAWLDAAPFRPGELLMVGSGTPEFHHAYPGVSSGRRAAPVETLAEAEALMGRAGAREGRVAIVGGMDFDAPGDAMRLGRLSGEVTLRRGSAEAGFRLLPARGDTPIPSRGGSLRFHSAAAAALLRPGTRVTGDRGEGLVVEAVDAARRAATVRLEGGGEPVEAPRSISWSAPLGEADLRLPLRRGQGSSDQACQAARGVPGTGRFPVPWAW